MRKQRHTAPGGGQNLGRVGALGVLAAGALCAAVLSVASRVPPTPIDTETIPGIEIGSAPEGDVTPAVRKDRRSGSRQRDGKRASHAGDRRARNGGSGRNGSSRGNGARAGGSALPVVYRDSGDRPGQNADGGPWSGGGGTDRPVSGTGPGGGDGAQPRSVPAPAPATAQPSGGEEVIDDDGAAPVPTGTVESENESEGEVAAGTAPAAATPAPTLARFGDSDDE
jgi:hypothetical protein